MATFAYLRVSTIGQAASGAGLDAQLDACIQAAGGTLDGVFRDEGVSGATSMVQRPGLMAAIESLRKGDTLIVGKRDRVARDLLVLSLIHI